MNRSRVSKLTDHMAQMLSMLCLNWKSHIAAAVFGITGGGGGGGGVAGYPGDCESQPGI